VGAWVCVGGWVRVGGCGCGVCVCVCVCCFDWKLLRLSLSTSLITKIVWVAWQKYAVDEAVSRNHTKWCDCPFHHSN
jgi:hypothetical protein